MTRFGRSQKDLFLTDLGLDKVFVYHFDSNSGKLSNQKSVEVAKGAGPRHLVEHPNQRWIYVVNEMYATVTVFGVSATESDDEPMFSGI